MNTRVTSLCATLALGLLLHAPASANVVSTFDTNDEGWQIFGDAQGASNAPTYQSTGGNPDGHIRATDDVSGGIWYFAAPTKFLGNQAGAYGNTLSFDLKQSSTTSPVTSLQSDVVLVGGGKTIAFDTASNPGTTWTPYSVTIDDASDWKLNDLNGAAATQSDIEQVLADLTALRIRGEYRNGDDIGYLDNVVLVVPEPASLALLSLGGLMLLPRRRETA